MIDEPPRGEEQAAPQASHLLPCPDSLIALPGPEGPSLQLGTLCTPESPLVDPVMAPGSQIAAAPEKLLKSTKDQAFDPFISLSEDKLRLVAEELLPLCDEIEARKRKRKRIDGENYRLALASVIANALRAAYHPTSIIVHYPRGLTVYSGHSDYYPDFLRAVTLNNVVETLSKLALLDTTRGKKRREGRDWIKLQSTFTATIELIKFLDERGITIRDLVRLQGRPTVILRNKRKRDVSYDPGAPHIAAMIESVRSYNDFLAQVELSLNLSEAEIERMHAMPERTGDPRPPINFDEKELCRIFNNGNFQEGGRFFRGWWINAPKIYRDHILINGKPTLEKDYSGCFLRMLYHLEGLEYPEDPYAIPEAMALSKDQGLNWNVVRTAIKRLTNIYLNASRRDIIRYFPDITCDLPVGLNKPEQIYSRIKETHQPIAHNFRTGYGVRLMRLESDMCANVLDRGVRERIPVLPIHDSFRVEGHRGAWLEQAMTDAYQERFPGFLPKIE